jgi:hypothetical protein
MGGGSGGESKEDKQARKRERRITDLARNETAQDTASGLTSDLRAVYGMKGMVPVSGTAGGSAGGSSLFSSVISNMFGKK